jgi:hypothetical protein
MNQDEHHRGAHHREVMKMDNKDDKTIKIQEYGGRLLQVLGWMVVFSSNYGSDIFDVTLKQSPTTGEWFARIYYMD